MKIKLIYLCLYYSHRFITTFIKCRSSPPEVFCKKDVLRNFAKFTGKHPCQSLFFNKVADPRPATLLKKRLWRRWFPGNFVKFLRTVFLRNTSGWLLLNRQNTYDFLMISREVNYFFLICLRLEAKFGGSSLMKN